MSGVAKLNVILVFMKSGLVFVNKALDECVKCCTYLNILFGNVDENYNQNQLFIKSTCSTPC